MKELNQVELEQVAGAGFWGDLLKGVVHAAEIVIDSAAESLKKSGVISEGTCKSIENLAHAGVNTADKAIDNCGI
ncbi:hypothetical protein ABLB69_14860 [Xenorhabdus khoisanae]|uniref:Uncharacterized protein n=1 Tax=Xenorhabdus khoisanae TaxID=880157 RepID=A0A0J5FPS1_9GAMM|nr:hypothetical protein [Xenorhabdus khoisanae]KMJ44283.1 hypothetical protein AB204_15120 [Xenorhabdus khoisanae]